MLQRPSPQRLRIRVRLRIGHALPIQLVSKVLTFVIKAIYTIYSVNHFNSFAINKTVQTIEPKDPNVTEFGGLKMTRKDEEKLKAAYGCSGCGGSHVGGSGKITFGKLNTDCEWLITVDDGSVIELSIKEFSVRLNFDNHLEPCTNDVIEIFGIFDSPHPPH